MEKINNREKEKREKQYTELRVLVLYSIYSLMMLISAVSLEWDHWIVPIIVVLGAAAWIIYFAQNQTYYIRSFLITCITMLDFIIYGFNATSFVTVVPVIGALSVMLAIYGVPENLYVVMGSFSFVLLYHIFYVGDIVWNRSALENCRLIIELISAIVIEYLVWHLVKRRVADKERRKQIAERMEAAEQSRNDFLANMSHELRTPINTVTGMSELVLQEDLPEEARSEVFDIQVAGRGLLSIVSDILDYTELESGNVELEEEPYNIVSTINDVINMALAQNQEKRLELIIDFDAGIPAGLKGDEQKIRRVITNLVGNAIKFTDKGCVTITVSYRKEQYGINLNVSVKDTGIGMEPQEIENMFYGFYQADVKRTRRAEGVGLGLAISDALIQRMGGFLNVKSAPGRGSRFSFSLPQEVLDDTPAITIEHPQAVSIICYFDIEKYTQTDIRDDYVRCINNTIRTLGVPMYSCQTLVRLNKMLKEGNYSHLFIGGEEYKEEKEFYLELSKKMLVTVVIDRTEEIPSEQGIGCIYKPFYSLSIANVINGNMDRYNGKNIESKNFVAPDAKVLIVDDNLMNLKVAEGLLLQYKIKISTATSGEEALEKIKTMDYDFIFMDHMMPGMDGVETLHRIRQKPGRYFQTVPVVALTANAIGGAREMFIQEGFQDFVAKPIDFVVLERVLRSFIPEKKMLSYEKYESQRKEEEKTDRIRMENEGENNVANQTEDIFSKLAAGGIDIDGALEFFAGDRDAYVDIAGIFLQIGDEKITQITEAYEKCDWENYTVLVHAVKSTSLTIGAGKLSEMAKSLESAGKEKREEEIRAAHADMMNEYAYILNLLRESGLSVS